MADKDYKALNIYSQKYPHEEAIVIGNKAGLIELRNAIDKALLNPDHHELTNDSVFVWDGEGYDVLVHCTEDEDNLKEFGLPYTCDWWKKNKVSDWHPTPIVCRHIDGRVFVSARNNGIQPVLRTTAGTWTYAGDMLVGELDEFIRITDEPAKQQFLDEAKKAFESTK